MGNRRRKMVRRKFKALPWNRHNKTTNTEEIPEQKINKIVEDNSVMLEKINHVSTICDSLLETFYTMADNNEIDFEEEEDIEVQAPMIKASQPPPEIKETTKQTPNFKRMTKKNLVKFAKENNIKVYAAMTKTNIIKAIEANL
jgi:hypothetical protein